MLATQGVAITTAPRLDTERNQCRIDDEAHENGGKQRPSKESLAHDQQILRPDHHDERDVDGKSLRGGVPMRIEHLP